MSDQPLVSIVIPCLQERTHIRAVLDSIAEQDYPRDRLEVLVVDGMSDDGTREIIQEFTHNHPYVHLLDNPHQNTPAALNIGIQNARGDVIVRMDAHTTYDPSYVTASVQALTSSDADVVGGVWKVVPDRDTLFGRAVALALTHPFGVGNASYKTSRITQPTSVDTVPFGTYRRQIFERIGMFNEDLSRSEDADLHRRIRSSGGKILLVPTIVSYYRARTGFTAFCRHYLRNGFLITFFLLKYGKVAFFGRHLVPLIFVSTVLGLAALSLLYAGFLWLLLVVLGAYSVANLTTSLRIAVNQRNVLYAAAMPPVFTLLHWCYGMGSLWGLLRAIAYDGLWRSLVMRKQQG